MPERRLRSCPARRQVLVLDACHSGAALVHGEEEDAPIRSVFEQAEGFVRIAASTNADHLTQSPTEKTLPAGGEGAGSDKKILN